MKRSHFIALVAGAAVMFLGPAAGMFASVVRMRRALALAQTLESERAAQLLARAAHASFVATTVGICVGALGLMVVIVSVLLAITTRSRAEAPGSRTGL